MIKYFTVFLVVGNLNSSQEFYVSVELQQVIVECVHYTLYF